MKYDYPTVRRDETIKETHFGTVINDPYRWLEDPDSEETKKSESELYNYERYQPPFKRGQFYYYFYNSGLQAQDVLYRLKSLEDKEPQVFFDPNKLSADGTAALSIASFSESGRYFAHGISYSGSDWVTIKVQDVDGKALNDTIEWVKFSGISWTHDEKGFFYTRYPKPSNNINDKGTETNQNQNAQIYYHQLGTNQDKDIHIYNDQQNPLWMFGAKVSDDGNFLLLTITESCEPVNKLYVKKLNNQSFDGSEWIKVIDDFKARYDYISNNGNEFLFLTNADAPRNKIVSIELNSFAVHEVIPESKNVLEQVSVSNNDILVCIYMEDVKNAIQLFDIKGKFIRSIPVDIGSVESLRTRKSLDHFSFKVISFLNPGIIYVYRLNQENLVTFKKSNIGGFDATRYQTQQVRYSSKDGTLIPMFITSLKGNKSNGPCMLYGYGGFSISLTPWFNSSWAMLLECFGMSVAVANIRGGSEYGEEWHKKGCLMNKQNCFDDFQYAAKYLIDNDYTRPEKLVINGGSNGGLLAAACALQAPSLFRCSVADVGVLDMLRFHKFTIGHAWMSDYGNPDKEEDFKNLLSYSPLHHKMDSSLPAMLLTTSDHDDRVVPLHSFKMIATLQHKRNENELPLMIRIESKAGHGAGKSVQKRIEETVDKTCFIAKTLNIE